MVATRRPTGQRPWPLILVEGEELSGKTHALCELSNHELVDRTFILDLDDRGALDQYGALGRYELLDPPASKFDDMLKVLDDATKVKASSGMVNVVAVDPGGLVWERLRDWADYTVRHSAASQKLLRRDPYASIEITNTLWDEIRNRWSRMVQLLRSYPGVGIIVCRARDVDGDYQIEAERGITKAVHAWVRFRRPHLATLVAAQTRHADLSIGGRIMPDEDPLGWLIFEYLGLPSLSSPSDNGSSPAAGPGERDDDDLVEGDGPEVHAPPSPSAGDPADGEAA